MFSWYAVWPASGGLFPLAFSRATPQVPRLPKSQRLRTLPSGAAGALLLLAALFSALLGSLLGSFLLGHSTSSLKQSLGGESCALHLAMRSPPRAIKPTASRDSERPSLVVLASRQFDCRSIDGTRSTFKSFGSYHSCHSNAVTGVVYIFRMNEKSSRGKRGK